MGCLDALASFSPGITAASQGLTGALQGAQERRKRERDDAMQMIEAMRQQRIDAQNQMLNQARLDDAKAKSDLRASQIAAQAKYIDALRKTNPDLAAQLEATGGDPDAIRDLIKGDITDKRTAEIQKAIGERQQTALDAAEKRAEAARIAAEERQNRALAASEARTQAVIAAAAGRQREGFENRQPPQSFVTDQAT